MIGLKWWPFCFFPKWRPARGRHSWRPAEIEKVCYWGHVCQFSRFWMKLNQKSMRSLTSSCMSGVTRVGDRGVLPIRSSNHAPFTPLGQGHSEETLKAVGPFYIVSYKAGEVKYPHIGGVNCRGLLRRPQTFQERSEIHKLTGETHYIVSRCCIISPFPGCSLLGYRKRLGERLFTLL